MEVFIPPEIPNELLKSLGLDRFVALDVETTGLDPAKDRMIEAGAVRFCDGREVETFNQLIACPFPLPKFITDLTGISEEMLRGAPDEQSVLTELSDFIGDDILAGQNIPFDLSFLQAANKRNRKRKQLFPLKAADSSLLARVLLPTLPSRGLSSMAQYFQLDVQEKHRALPDARRTGQVLMHLLSFFNRVDIKTVDLLRRIAEGLQHPSAWIFQAWANYLMTTSSVLGRFDPYVLANLKDNILGKLPNAESISATEAQLEEEENYSEIDRDEIAGIFQTDGHLRQGYKQYEFRPQQVEMTTSVVQSLNGGGILAVEAGTGVGKSLAYLIPSIFWAQANRQLGERVIVSTNTRNLQEQLFYKDLPSLVDILPLRFSAVLLKGRSNYLCRRRWENLTTEHPLKLSNNERLALLSLVLWAEQSRTGDVSEVGVFGGEGSNAVWGRLASEGGSCRGKRCHHRHHCFHHRVRSASSRAHIVIVNHALLMSDIAADHIPIGTYRTLIVDEAHHLERSAAQHLGKELNRWIFRSWFSRIYESGEIPRGLLAQILLGVGAAKERHPILPSLEISVEKAADEVTRLQADSADFFEKLTAVLRRQAPQQENPYSWKFRLHNPDQYLMDIFSAEPAILDSIRIVELSLREIASTLGDIPQLVLPRLEDWIDEMHGAVEELHTYREMLEFFFSAPDENWVYWAEIPGKVEYTAVLYAAPLNAGEILRDHLFSNLRTVVLTSATLTVAGRFQYFLRKVGIEGTDRVETLLLGSPFDFQKQMLIGLPAFLPSPKDPRFEYTTIALIDHILTQVPKGTLGLFTSHRMLQNVGEKLQKGKSVKSVLIQGMDGSRDQLLNRFRNEPGSILLGTDSFWEGIDVVGEALELLLVAKLPFEVPSEPFVEARLEKLKKEGKDPFLYYTVPEAIIRLRQGVGRLIRSRTDRGAALIFDSRLVSSRYGKHFLESLPVKVNIFGSEEETVEVLKRFFQCHEPPVQEES